MRGPYNDLLQVPGRPDPSNDIVSIKCPSNGQHKRPTCQTPLLSVHFRGWDWSTKQLAMPWIPFIELSQLTEQSIISQEEYTGREVVICDLPQLGGSLADICLPV